MSQYVRRAILGLASLLLMPAAVYAQASLTGVIRDTSGAVLPGVTVEAASPALIEKVRTAVSDGNGLYRIEDLRPGAYTMTFSLAGLAWCLHDDLLAGRLFLGQARSGSTLR
jgi:hypothetical protein